jgi:16S rRNA (uracil1498-N3)-methyltransferase
MGGFKSYSCFLTPNMGGRGFETAKVLTIVHKYKINFLILYKLIFMQIFYAPYITGDTYTLDEKESRHLIRVLRMTKGSAVRLIDGKGNLYEGIINDPDQNKCTIVITGKTTDFEKRNYRLHVAISPLKNPERFEWFVEKSVEIGIDEITPLICKNTEKPVIKSDRLNNLIISAMKQSLKAKRTVLNEPSTFKDFISMKPDAILMIAHCDGSLIRRRVSDVYTKGRNAIILIGPEGDFTKEEIDSAINNGFIPVHLGTSRLRTETAGIAVCHSIYFMNQ